MPAVGASHGVGWGWEGLVGVGGREEGRSRGKRSGPGGSGMQSEQCYRQWRKCTKGGGAGRVRVVVVAGRGLGGVVRGEAGEPGAGEWGAGGGLSPAGMAGVPWGPVGAEAPHVGWVRNLGLFFRHRSS